MGGHLAIDVLDAGAGTSLILTMGVLHALEEFSASRVAASVADLHLGAVVRPGEVRDLSCLD